MISLKQAQGALQCELDRVHQDGEEIVIDFGIHENGHIGRGIRLSVSSLGLYRVECSTCATTGTLFTLANAYKRATDFIARFALVPA